MRDGKEIILPTRQSQALLAYMALQDSRPIPRGVLASLFWGGKDERLARHSLAQALSSLRKALGGGQACPLQVTRREIHLDPTLFVVDVSRFRDLVIRQDVAGLEAAIQLHRGELLKGFPHYDDGFEAWLLDQRQELAATLLQALERILAHCEERQDWDQALHYARMVVAVDPFDEASHRRIMGYHTRLKRGEAAIQHFKALRKSLRAELQVDPEPETVALYGKLLGSRGVSPLDKDRPPPAPDKRPSLRVGSFEPLFPGAAPGDLGPALRHELLMALTTVRSLRAFPADLAPHLGHSGPDLDIGAMDPDFELTAGLAGGTDDYRVVFTLRELERGTVAWRTDSRCGRDEIYGLLAHCVEGLCQAIAQRDQAQALSLLKARARRRSGDLPAFWRARACLSRFDQQRLGWAQATMSRVLRQDPEFVDARAYKAYLIGAPGWWRRDERPYREPALQEVLEALAQDPGSALCQALAADILAQSGDFKGAAEKLSASMAKPPEDAWVLSSQAFVSTVLGRHREASDLAYQAMALSGGSNDMIAEHLGLALFGEERFEEAAEVWRGIRAKAFWHHGWLASCYGHMGVPAMAREAWALYERLAPGRSIFALADAEPYHQEADQVRLLQGLVLAGCGT